MGLAIGIDRVAPGGLYIGIDKVSKLYIGLDLAYQAVGFIPIGTFYAFDDSDNLHTWEPTNIGGQSILRTYSYGVTRTIYGLTTVGTRLYGVSRDLIINPVPNRLHRFTTDGTTRQVGVFPEDGTFPVVALSGIAHAPKIDRFYMIEPTGGFPPQSLRIWRFPALAAIVEASSTRAIFPENTAPLITLSAYADAGSIAVVGDWVYFLSGEDLHRFPASADGALTSSDVTLVGTFPSALARPRGMSHIGLNYVGVADDNHDIWYAQVTSPAGAYKVGRITNVGGEIQAFTLLSPEARDLLIGANNLLIGANQLTIGGL